jgi:hypothetical protein
MSSLYFCRGFMYTKQYGCKYIQIEKNVESTVWSFERYPKIRWSLRRKRQSSHQLGLQRFGLVSLDKPRAYTHYAIFPKSLDSYIKASLCVMCWLVFAYRLRKTINTSVRIAISWLQIQFSQVINVHIP